MFRFLVLFCAVALVTGETTQVYQQCANNAGQLPLSATIGGCQQAPCLLPQMQDFTLAINFTTPNAVDSMRTIATAYLNIGGFFIPIAYSLGEKALTCNFLTGAQCPTQPGQNLEYVLRTYVEPFFPVGAAVDIELKIVDEQDNPLTCLRVPIRIVEPASSKTIA